MTFLLPPFRLENTCFPRAHTCHCEMYVLCKRAFCKAVLCLCFCVRSCSSSGCFVCVCAWKPFPSFSQLSVRLNVHHHDGNEILTCQGLQLVSSLHSAQAIKKKFSHIDIYAYMQICANMYVCIYIYIESSYYLCF